MDMEQIGKLITNVGFPIVIALMLLFRIDPAIRELNENLIRLTAVIDARLK